MIHGFAPVLLLAFCIGCGGGTDGKPVAPPATPAPAPPPEPPEAPTGIRVSDRGEDFVEWTWDPSEGATRYEADVYLAGSSVDERTRVHTEEPSYRWEGLPPRTAVAIFVRAVRETAGGRAESEWAGPAGALTLSADIPVGACSDERQLALDWELDPILVPAWDPERPFRVWIDEGPIRTGGDRIDRPDFLEEEVLEPLRDVADRIKERLGYSIFDPTDLLLSRPSAGEPVIGVRVTEVRASDPPWDPDCAVTVSPMSAIPGTAEVVYNEPSLTPRSPAQASPKTGRTRRSSTSWRTSSE